MSDVIQLHRKTGGQASFCVSVDNSDDEDAMYNPDKWPAGALTRPYKRANDQESADNTRPTSTETSDTSGTARSLISTTSGSSK